jgi:CubicO group peptidase (beta-lactamase class C family)
VTELSPLQIDPGQIWPGSFLCSCVRCPLSTLIVACKSLNFESCSEYSVSVWYRSVPHASKGDNRVLDIQGLEKQVAEQMTNHKIPGLALAVVHHGQVIYEGGFGVTSVEENGLPVTPRTLFRIGSTTKPLVGTAILRLVETGQLDLDSPIVRYIPWLRFSRPSAEQIITLRMLLTHTSGLDSQNNPYGSRDPDGGERYVRESLPAIPFISEPGRLYSYTNSGLALAGYIAASVYGKDLGTMVNELLFAPLSMERSTFDPLVALTYPFAFSHDLRHDGTLELARPVVESTGYHAAGFAMTTVLEMANFAIMQTDEGRFGGEQLLTASTVREMQTVHAPHYTVDGAGYGLTFTINSYKGLKRVGHGGGIHNYHCSFDMLPEARTAVIIMGSRVAPPGIHLKIINEIFDQVLGLPADVPATPEPMAIDPDRSTWPKLTGLYLSRLWGLLAVAVEGDGLTLEMMGERMPLKAHSAAIYFGSRPDGKGIRSVGFVPEESGVPCRYLMVDSWTAERFEPDPGFSPDQALLESHAGIYLSPANGREDLRLWVGEDGRLWARFVWYPGQEFPCIPLNSDTRFASGGGSLTVEEGSLLTNGWRLPKATGQ